jgi:type I restriction-modification system DNA methylase subunit
MLREMRDAAGDSGEFYTPRPVVRLMVEAVNPQLGETGYVLHSQNLILSDSTVARRARQ